MTSVTWPHRGVAAPAASPIPTRFQGETTTMSMSMPFTARHAEPDHVRRAKSLASDRRSYRRLIALSMPFFVVATLVQRVVRPTAGGPRQSILAQARARAGTIIPFMFMG